MATLTLRVGVWRSAVCALRCSFESLLFAAAHGFFHAMPVKGLPLGQSIMSVIQAYGAIFVMCAPLTMFVTLRDYYDNPKKTPSRFAIKQKNLEVE